MKKTNLVGEKAALARKWVPFLCGFFRDGAAVPGSDVVVSFDYSERPDLHETADDKVWVNFGAVSVCIPYPGFFTFVNRGELVLENATVFFPDRWPKIEQVPGGFRVTWKRSPEIHNAGLAAALARPTIGEVFVYPDRIDIRVNRGPDQIITWE